jgi:hypothetical protein
MSSHCNLNDSERPLIKFGYCRLVCSTAFSDH